MALTDMALQKHKKVGALGGSLVAMSIAIGSDVPYIVFFKWSIVSKRIYAVPTVILFDAFDSVN